MRTCLASLLALSAFQGLATGTHAHVGDEIYPFFELLDEDLDRIDLTDGSVEDWLEVIGEPPLTAVDFYWGYWGEMAYDPSDVDFRIWLAWHEDSSTLWIAMERFDDLYLNFYDGEGPYRPYEMQLWDSSIRFMVDGDHTGGTYSYFLGRNCHDCTPDQVLENYRQAQEWVAIAETPDGEHLEHYGPSEWVVGEPYADAGGGVIGKTPATTVTEFRVTPFDDLIYNDEASSEASQLYPGKTIGFSIATRDYDDTEWKDGHGPVATPMSLTGTTQSLIHADFFVDGLLIGAGDDPSLYDDASAVEPSSWARIKASF